jgi:hypothetical protein
MSRALTSVVAWLTLATVTGCAQVPVWEAAREYRVLATTPREATYACVVSLTDSLGYTVRASDRFGGFVRVERDYVPADAYHGRYIQYQARDLINVSIITDTERRMAVRLTA